MQNLNGRKKTFQFSMQVSVTSTFVQIVIFWPIQNNVQIPNIEADAFFTFTNVFFRCRYTNGKMKVEVNWNFLEKFC